jgi:YHS domain-containing protein
VPAIDATHGVGLEGYDAVAYFLDHRPIRGSDAYTHSWNGVVWKFASGEHRDLFAADPAHYAPQYGGYCAYAVANHTTAHGSPKQWAVVNDRLFLNNNPLAKKLWDRDRPGHIRAGDQNWLQISKRAVSVDSPQRE